MAALVSSGLTVSLPGADTFAVAVFICALLLERFFLVAIASSKAVTVPQSQELRQARRCLHRSEGAHSTQSPRKILVSCGSLPFRLEAQTRRLPSEVNIGKPSKSGCQVMRS